MSKVIAVDFDGTLTIKDAFPVISEPNRTVIDVLLQEQKAGAKIILWTCRCGQYLDDAIEWCKQQGIVFDAVNENLPERTEKYGNDSRKLGADEYWEDKSLTPKDIIIKDAMGVLSVDEIPPHAMRILEMAGVTDPCFNCDNFGEQAWGKDSPCQDCPYKKATEAW